VSRHNGTEVDTTGDGFFVRFDSPAQAILAARAARQATVPLGIAIRAGIHTGECELEGNKLAGMAVHIAARIQAAAHLADDLEEIHLHGRSLTPELPNTLAQP